MDIPEITTQNAWYLVDLQPGLVETDPASIWKGRRGGLDAPFTRTARWILTLFRNANPWRDLRHVMTPLTERRATMQPFHFSGPFRLLDLAPELIVEIARHLSPIDLFVLAQVCRASRATVFSDPLLRSTKLTAVELWNLTRLRERDFAFPDNQDVPCGICLGIHPATSSLSDCPGEPVPHFIKHPRGAAFCWKRGSDPDMKKCLFPYWPSPSLVRYLAKHQLLFHALPEDKTWRRSKMVTVHRDAAIFTREGVSTLRFIDDRLLWRTRIHVAKFFDTDTENSEPFVGWYHWIMDPYVCHHLRENFYELVASNPTHPTVVHDRRSGYRFDISMQQVTIPEEPASPFNREHAELGERDGRVFSCPRCCTDWSFAFKDFPETHNRLGGRTMIITSWKLLGGFNEARRDDWAWETHIDPMGNWRIFREPGEFCKAWEGNACVQEDGVLKYHATIDQAFIDRMK